MCLGGVGVDTQSLGELGDGLIEFSLISESYSQIVMRISVVGFNTQCFGVMGDGLIRFSLIGQGRTQVVMGNIVSSGYCQSMCPERRTIFPILKLTPGSDRARQNHQACSCWKGDLRKDDPPKRPAH